MYRWKFACGKSIANYDVETDAKYGHRPIVLLGGGTTLIGDPSGKDKTRRILNEGTIKKNIKNIKRHLKKYWILKRKLDQFC